ILWNSRAPATVELDAYIVNVSGPVAVYLKAIGFLRFLQMAGACSVVRTTKSLILLALLLGPAQLTCGASFINDVIRDENYVAWPVLVEVLRGPGQFRSYTGAGNEIFFYRGNMAQLNEVLQKFAAVDIPIHDVIL